MKLCALDGCQRVVCSKSARGLCRPHYRKLMKYGDPLVTKLGRPVEVRFAEKIARSDGCWNWIGRKNKQGYGIFTIGHTGKALAHRFAWQLEHGSAPMLHVLHKCDNPSCVRPEHLFLGTQRDNLADMWTKGRGKPPPIGARWMVCK